MKKYRIVEIDPTYFKVQTKRGWFGEWRTVERWEYYDTPRKTKHYGGFFGDIVTETTETGDMRDVYFSTAEAAKEWIRKDKENERHNTERRRTRRRRVVHRE